MYPVDKTSKYRYIEPLIGQRPIVQGVTQAKPGVPASVFTASRLSSWDGWHAWLGQVVLVVTDLGWRQLAAAAAAAACGREQRQQASCELRGKQLLHTLMIAFLFTSRLCCRLETLSLPSRGAFRVLTLLLPCYNTARLYSTTCLLTCC